MMGMIAIGQRKSHTYQCAFTLSIRLTSTTRLTTSPGRRSTRPLATLLIIRLDVRGVPKSIKVSIKLNTMIRNPVQLAAKHIQLPLHIRELLPSLAMLSSQRISASLMVRLGMSHSFDVLGCAGYVHIERLMMFLAGFHRTKSAAEVIGFHWVRGDVDSFAIRMEKMPYAFFCV